MYHPVAPLSELARIPERPAAAGRRASRRAAFLAPLLVILLFGATDARPAESQTKAQGPLARAVPGEVIVAFEAGVSRREQQTALARVDAATEERLGRLDVLASVDRGEVTGAIAKLERDPRVEYAEPNFLLYAQDHPGIPSDPAYHELWALENFGQTVNGTTGTPDADIDAREAWDVTTGSAAVVVGVVDSGVDFSHPDLGGSAETSPLMWVNPGEDCAGCRTNGLDDDGNGYVDDWRGWDFVNDDNDPFDDSGHGTHVAGSIAASGNDGAGVVGVNWTAKLMALRFLNARGEGTTADVVRAILYAGAKGAHVVNASWSGTTFSQALMDAIAQADRSGSLVVAAAGNETIDTDARPRYPSSFDVPNVLSVAASDQSDVLASFSNYGATSIDVAAPGVNIFSTVPGGSHRHASGTSMATAHASGAAALAKAAFPTASDLGLRALLVGTADALPSLAGRTASGGRVNVNGAVRCAGRPLVLVESPRSGFVATVGESVAVRAIATSCADAAGASVTAAVNGLPVALTARGDGLYEGTYTAAAPGPVALTVTAAVEAASATRAVEGRAVQNYRTEEEAFAWIDATVEGTNTGLVSDDDSVAVALPFPFNFYGQSFTSVQISANGYLVFGDGAPRRPTNVAIPNAREPNGLVAPFWDDLDPSAGGSIWYRTTGTPPSRRFVVAWVGVPHFPSIGAATFEAVLEEGTNDVRFQYADVQFEDASLDYGASATVGLESPDGVIGRQFSFDQPSLRAYESAKAIRFTTRPPAPVATPSPPRRRVPSKRPGHRPPYH